MQFIGYKRANVRGAKFDWDASVAVSDDLRRALHPHDPDVLQAGRLRRPFCMKPTTPGRRSRHVFVGRQPEPITHDTGALVFAYADESWFLIEAPESRN